MIPNKFLYPTKVFDHRYGFGEVESINQNNMLVAFTFKRFEEYNLDGRDRSTDLFPSLLTLAEAKARGFSVPKEYENNLSI